MHGLQFKENLSIISGGYPGEDVGSNGVTQNWTDTPGASGSSDVTYYFHDSQTMDNNNSSRVDVRIVESWTASLRSDNTIDIRVTVSIPSITRTRIGSPVAYSTYIFVRQNAWGQNIWTSGGCDDASVSHTIATNIDLGTYTISLPPESEGSERGTVYFRSNSCGHNDDTPPSLYIDEFWLGLNFRNILPKDYRPGSINPTTALSPTSWLSHNRNAGWAGIWDGSSFKEMRTSNGAVSSDNPPLIKHSTPDSWLNMRKIGLE